MATVSENPQQNVQLDVENFEKQEVNVELDEPNDPSSSSNTTIVKDSTQSWLVCIGAFLIQLFIMGFTHAFGVYFVVFIDEFKETKAKAAWVGSLCYSFTFMFGPLASFLINKYGSRIVAIMGSVLCFVSMIASSFVTNINLLFITFSVPFGLGNCLAFSTTMSLPGIYFDKYVSVATGFIVSGSSFGTLVLSPLSQLLITHWGWRNAFRFFGCLTLSGVWSGFMHVKGLTSPRSTQQKIRLSLGRRMLADLYLWKNRVFVIWVIVICLVMFGYYVPYVHLVSFAEDQGISAEMGSTLMMLFGAGTAVGRLAFGKIITLGVLDRLHMHQLSMVITGAGTMLLPLITSFAGLVAYVIIIGLVDGCFVVLLPVMTSALVGADHMVLAWGSVIGCSSLTNMLGPPIAGWIYDATGSYNIPFHVSGIPVICGAIALFLIPWAQRTSTGTNILQAAIESPYSSISEEHLQSDQEMFEIGSSSKNSFETIQHTDEKKSYIVVDLENQSSYMVSGRSFQGSFTVQQILSTRGIPQEVIQAVDSYRQQMKNRQSHQRGRLPRRRLVSECRPEDLEIEDSRDYHSVPQSLQNLENADGMSNSQQSNQLYAGNYGAYYPESLRAVAGSTEKQWATAFLSRTPNNLSSPRDLASSSARREFPDSGQSDQAEDSQNVEQGAIVVNTDDHNNNIELEESINPLSSSPISSPPVILPMITEESSRMASAVDTANNGSNSFMMVPDVISPPVPAPNLPSQAENTADQDRPTTVISSAGASNNLDAVISDSSIGLLWQELDASDINRPDTSRPNNESSQDSPVEGGVFHISDC